MINVREVQALQTQLLKEGNARFELQEQNQRLAAQVDILQREMAKKEYELSLARAAQATPEAIQEVVENNLALKEQVKALKDALSHAQPLAAPVQDDALAGHDLQSLLRKLGAKEEELSAMRAECRIWEEQVIQLKFELQSERFNSQEALKEQRLRAQKPPMDPHKSILSGHTTRTLAQELQEYKSLALERAQYWKLAEVSLDKVNLDLAALRKENRALQERLQRLEDEANETDSSGHGLFHGVLGSPAAHALRDERDEARRQTRVAQDTLTSVMKEMQRLQQELDDVPVLRKIEARRVQGVIRDLKQELTAQTTRVEQLQSAVALYSPRNSRGIDLGRKRGHFA
ncbi:hypothetical protein SPRG_09921 [Saprolegnia parasitica CBS 223.65]|uniref:Uncharacterized protein n=1 Tax=Saprolegnia parasitica (strain CBS 223.65) TaxID=695850 RepID=A0A067C0J3_SAPPC|nr:hypothetical protein SPRG_09921 [Saprolegnia parasitica CBS 223.65]KDO24284.1 hypothetical protein SPRG_09921 [Saprolegnia parasitica CBS 223.65]|eukprot:XP_012205055.1 hypothetical protein SPRG_09921 [Saprolegnia parasitica CBS 223.65]